MIYPTRKKSFLHGLVVVVVILAGSVSVSNAFSTTRRPHLQQQQHLSSNVVRTTSSSSSSSLNVGWTNPFSNKDDVEEEVAPIIVKEELAPGPLDTKNGIALGTWVSLIAWAFLLAPGELGSTTDNDMIQLLISQPTPRPESINELWFAIWNCFVVVPAAIAALEAPVGKGQRLPATPFLSGSAFFGYFALGPYFATRTVRDVDEVELTEKDMGWFSRTVFENRLFGVLFSCIALSIPVSSELLSCDWSHVLPGFVELIQSSRFVAVASIDIVIMSILAGILVGEDSKRRGWDDKSTILTVVSILLPVITPCLYLAARPSLPQPEE